VAYRPPPVTAAEIREIAWTRGYHAHGAVGALSFTREHPKHGRVFLRVTVEDGRAKIESALSHPRHGWTTCVRRGLELHEVRWVFQNPRVHGLAGKIIKRVSPFEPVDPRSL
jgi:hypothetical protein